MRLQELLGEVVKWPGVDDEFAKELDEIFISLTTYSYFVEFQRRELQELCKEMDHP